MSLHATAVIDPAAVIGPDCRIGPYCVIGAGVELGAGCVLDSHVVLRGPMTLGARSRVHAFAVLGDAPQRKQPTEGALGVLHIGADCVVREHVTVHRGNMQGTRIGDRCLLMAGAHVAHDVHIGADVVIANGVQLAGHVVVEDFVTMGGLAGVAQHVRVGESAFVAAGAMCERDVPPFVIVQGDRARVRALNRVGLERRGVPAESLAALRAAFRVLYIRSARAPREIQSSGDNAKTPRALCSDDPYVRRLLAALDRES